MDLSDEEIIIELCHSAERCEGFYYKAKGFHLFHMHRKMKKDRYTRYTLTARAIGHVPLKNATRAEVVEFAERRYPDDGSIAPNRPIDASVVGHDFTIKIEDWSPPSLKEIRRHFADYGKEHGIHYRVAKGRTPDNLILQVLERDIDNNGRHLPTKSWTKCAAYRCVGQMVACGTFYEAWLNADGRFYDHYQARCDWLNVANLEPQNNAA